MIENAKWLKFIPDTWVVIDFKDIAKSISLSGKKLPQRDYISNGILPVIDQGQNFIAGYTNETNLEVDCKLPIIVFGDHTKVIKFINFSFVAGADGVKVLQPSKIINPKFLYYMLLIIPLPDKGYARHFQYLEKSLVPLPPLPEQQRIVAKIEELFTKLDAGIETMKKIQIQLKCYRQSVLKSAFEGKLTAEWREAHKGKLEPASLLLERIKAERKKAGKYKELPALDTTELPELPEGWVWTRVGEITQPSVSRITPKQNDNMIYIGLEHIQKDTGKLLYYGKANEVKSLKTVFKKGDLLYGRLRPYLNKVYVSEFDGLCSTDILVFTKSELISNKYIMYRLLTEDFVRYTSQNMNGVQHPRVSFQTIAIFKIKLPPLPEQQKIVEETERHFSIADKIEATIEQSLKQAERLRQSILKHAFEGKLVTQDPSDEPAEKLLERIKAEKF
jgi:type I restriction enzyme S subunit